MATRRDLRVFGIGVGTILTAIGVWRYLAGDALLPPVLGGGGGLLVLLGVLAPALLRPLHLAWMRVVAPLSWFNTRLLLGAVYFGILLPTGLVRRLVGDPLQLRGPRGARRRSTYWVDRVGSGDRESYRRQV